MMQEEALHSIHCLLYFQLQSNEFLNVDLMLEEVLHTLVIKPLRQHLSMLFSQVKYDLIKLLIIINNVYYKDFTRSGCLSALSCGMRSARARGPADFGVPAEYAGAAGEAAARACAALLTRMREAFSPVEKLDCLLRAIKTILEAVSDT